MRFLPRARSACAVLLYSTLVAREQRIGQRSGLQDVHALEGSAPPPSGESRADGGAETLVTALHRFAVKGLDFDSLSAVQLERGGAFPHDRQYAFNWMDAAEQFSAAAPTWLHKANFLCAFTANKLMASFASTFDDATHTLTVSQRGGAVAVRARLDEPAGRAVVAGFFTNLSGRAVRMVGAGGAPSPRQLHQFGNTASGLKAGDGSTRTIHIVNVNTVRALSAASGAALRPERFRANVLLGGALPAWREFEWVGRTVHLGGVTLRVIKRTVRCAGVNVDALHGAGVTAEEVVDVPALLTRHFPEHGPYLGVYAQVISDGVVRLGDRVIAA